MLAGTVFEEDQEFLIKICGVRQLDEALCAIDGGSNALGFNFYPGSPRYIDPAAAQEIIVRLPQDILTVAVMVVEESSVKESIGALRERVPSLGSFQLHGLRCKVKMSAIEERIFIAAAPSDASCFPDHEVIIDTSWGGGKIEDWEQVGQIKRPFILSGGLTSENVAEAITLLHPAGVDVCSGVESAPGIKDREKVKRFLKNVRCVLEGSGQPSDDLNRMGRDERQARN